MMHPNNCYQCKWSVENKIPLIDSIRDTSGVWCKSPLLTHQHYVVNTNTVMNFVSVMGCASFEPNK